MAFSPADIGVTAAAPVAIDANPRTVDLSDGRTIAVPVAWHPRLAAGAASERGNWRLIAGGDGTNCPDLDEDIAVAPLLEGRQKGGAR